MDAVEIIRRIEIRIKEIGMSKTEFYEQSGISSATYSQWNTGQFKPSKRKLEAAAHVLGVSMEYLINGEKPTPTKEDGLAERINRLTPENRQKLEQYMADLLQYQETQERLERLLKSQGKQ